jgi:hypothetical protein
MELAKVTFRGSFSAAMLAAACLAPAAQAEPFVVRNQNPLLAPFGLPNPLPARLPEAGGGRFAANLHWGNAQHEESNSDEDFVVDAEMLEFRLRYQRALGPRLALYAELPWRRTWEGVLDGFIDRWHDITGLPGDSRDQGPEDRLLVEHVIAGQSAYRFDQPGSGIGDIPVGLGYQLMATPDTALSAWLTLKAPTGDPEDLTGSGALDVALSLAAERALSGHLRVFGQLDATWLGDGDLLPALQEDLVWSGMAGLSWNAWRTLDLTAQLAANSRIYSAAGALAGDALVLVFGGSWRTAGGWRFDVSVSEDVDVNASPDVVLNFGLARTLR